jgi:hypothetical protein
VKAHLLSFGVQTIISLLCVETGILQGILAERRRPAKALMGAVAGLKVIAGAMLIAAVQNSDNNELFS